MIGQMNGQMIGKFVTNTAWMLLMIAVSGLIYIRSAPHDTEALHLAPPTGAKPDQPVIKPGSALFSQQFSTPPADIMKRLNDIALATPRTRSLAGSVEDGLITYVSRSRVFGFPDYTTVQVAPTESGSQITIYGRLRFGKSDFGVNRQRIQGWLQAL